MRLASLVAGISLFILTSGWETDFEFAKERALKEHKFILLNFSGSDWCVPCINLRRELFDDPAFKEFSDMTG